VSEVSGMLGYWGDGVLGGWGVGRYGMDAIGFVIWDIVICNISTSSYFSSVFSVPSVAK
jgi:hypothetical protein